MVAVVASWTAWLQARPGVVPGAGRGEAVDPAVLRTDLVTIVGDGTPRVVGTPFRIGDLDGDGAVDGNDLGRMLAAWGGSGPEDINGDGTVNADDLGALLGDWGP
ncbi:MAG: hypothetical protein ACKOJI_04865 [Phycisphaerales bacterium]